MPVKWSVREARRDDLPGVREILVEYQKWLGVDSCFEGYDAELDNLPGVYALPKGNLFVATFNSVIVGCVAIRELMPGIAEMKRLFVREEARGHGIGRALVRRGLREARKLGYQSVRLDTIPTMDAAVKLYQDMGFTPTGAYYETPNQEVVFLERRVA